MPYNVINEMLTSFFQLTFKIMNKLLPFVFSFFVFSAISQDTLKVPSQYANIQAALDNASPEAVIMVAPGTYTENIEWPESVIGIDLISEQGSEFTTIDGNANGSVIYKATRNEAGSIIRGFEITNGEAENGGGVFIEGVGTDLENLDVNNNTANDAFGLGGGIYLESYSGRITNCKISNNTVRGFMTASGGGVFVNGLDGDLYIENSTISLNEAIGGNSSNRAGISIGGKKHSVTLTNVILSDNKNSNRIWGQEAGAYITADTVNILSSSFRRNTNDEDATNSEGGALTLDSPHITIEDCNFSQNRAKKGSAIFLEGELGICNINSCTFSLNKGEYLINSTAENVNATISNCLITRNEGFAFQHFSGANSNPSFFHFNHVTMVDNSDGFTILNDKIHISNSIIWNDGELIEDGEFIASLTPGTIRVNSSIIREGYPGASVLDIDPLLDPDRYFPLAGSPALGYGNPAFTNSISLNGNSRPLPINTLPDIGAIELDQPGVRIGVRFFYDDNQDGSKTVEEPFIALGKIEFQEREFVNFSADGFDFILDLGDHTLNYTSTGLEDWVLTTQPSYELMITDSLYYEELLFGLAPKVDSLSLSSFIEMEAFRCAERIHGAVSFQNNYKLAEEATLFLEVDERIEEIEFSLAPDLRDENIYGWEFDEILPLQEKLIDFVIKVPEIMNADQVGETYSFKSWIDVDETASAFEYNPQLRCSYDPNDKNVNDRDIQKSQLDNTTLAYRIRFQNTGNDYARDVLVIDTLSGDLDLSSFDVKGSSHPENLIVTIAEDSIFSFNFKEIFLIDSLTNPELSNGHIDFTIKPKTTLETNHEITNTAHIIFDSNPPIVTNTVISVITNPVANDEIDFDHAIEVYPNPTSDNLTIKSNNISANSNYQIIDSNGRIVKSGSGIKKIDVSDLITGNYIIRIVQGNESYSLSFIKQ